MSEKRYYLKNVCGDEGLYDNENGCIIVNKNSLLDLDENWDTIVDLLNEQQVKIEKQDEEIKKLKRTERSWRRIHCCNKESDNCGIVIEQEATIKQLQDTVYDELDKALKVLEEIYEDYPKNNVHRLYNNLKGLKEMIR